MLQHASTYEIMRPEDVGLAKSNLVLGKHSGRHAFRDRVRELGFALDEFETNRAFKEFKKLADKKKDVYDGDIEAIIMNVDNASSGPWVLKSLQVQTSTDKPAQAAVVLMGDDQQEARGDCNRGWPDCSCVSGAGASYRRAIGAEELRATQCDDRRRCPG